MTRGRTSGGIPVLVPVAVMLVHDPGEALLGVRNARALDMHFLRALSGSGGLGAPLHAPGMAAS